MQLIPRDEKFYGLFNEQAENIHKAAKMLVALFENYQEVEKQVSEIKFLEHKGDQLTHALMKKLNRTFITPFDREDIHALGSALDDVLDLVDAAASRFITYKIKKVTPGAQQLGEGDLARNRDHRERCGAIKPSPKHARVLRAAHPVGRGS